MKPGPESEVKADTSSIRGSDCFQTVRELDRMGIRFAGSPGEKKAARWIERRFREAGLENVRQQEFPCLTFSYSKCRLQAWSGGRRRTIPSLPGAHSRPTPPGGVEGGLVFIERIPDSAGACRTLAGSRMVLIFSSELFQFDKFRRLMEAAPAAVLIVDDRLPGDEPIAIGFPRYWVDFMSCPVVGVPFLRAWELVRSGVERLRLEIDSAVKESKSQNVLGEVRGSRSPEEVVVVCGHHDSVINNPGADDNCTGVAAVVALARCFSKSKPIRTLRFISYGAEEQLSEGARHYAFNAHDRERIRFVLNVDSIGAWMGKTEIYYTGPKELVDTIEAVNRDSDFPGHVIQELSPFSDHFPLNLFGIPAVWYYRKTATAARHYHHSRLETPAVVSPAVLERTIRQQARLLERLVLKPSFPFARRLPEAQMRKLRQMARQWYGVTRTDLSRN